MKGAGGHERTPPTLIHRLPWEGHWARGIRGESASRVAAESLRGAVTPDPHPRGSSATLHHRRVVEQAANKRYRLPPPPTGKLSPDTSQDHRQLPGGRTKQICVRCCLSG